MMTAAVVSVAVFVICYAVALHGQGMRQHDEETQDIVYRFQVNGQIRYEPELPPADERDSGPVTVYYGYRINA